MKNLVLIVLLVVSFELNSQEVIPDYTYCEIVGTAKFLSTKVRIAIDYGQVRKIFKDRRVVDEDGKVKDFNSMVDALNYMGEKGWHFAQAYTVTVGNQNVYHWLLKRKLTDEDKANYIPITKEEANKDE